MTTKTPDKELKWMELRNASLLLPATSVNKRTGTIDSERGVLTIYQKQEKTNTTDTFTIYYDIGLMSGTHMCKALEKDCSYYSEVMVKGQKAIIGLKKRDILNEIIVTIGGADTKEWESFPANFWMTVKGTEDVKAFLDAVLTYKKKK